MIPKKAGFGVMGVILRIFSNGYLVNQTNTKIGQKTVLNFTQKINSGMITNVPTYFTGFAKEKKVICVRSFIVIK